MSLQVACGGRTSSLSPGSSVGCEGGSGAPAPPPPEPTTSRRRTTTRMPATTRFVKNKIITKSLLHEKC